MPIVTVPQLSDNYAYLIIDDASKECAVVDCAEPDAVIGFADTQRPPKSRHDCSGAALGHGSKDDDSETAGRRAALSLYCGQSIERRQWLRSERGSRWPRRSLL